MQALASGFGVREIGLASRVDALRREWESKGIPGEPAGTRVGVLHRRYYSS